MDNSKIYLQDIELAIEMKEAGFDKECVHYDSFETFSHYYFEWIHHIFYHAYNIAIKQDYNVEADRPLWEGKLYLPTLGEIDLPEGVTIEREGGTYYALDNFTGYEIGERGHQTELEARCHAWLWANKKEVKNG